MVFETDIGGKTLCAEVAKETVDIIMLCFDMLGQNRSFFVSFVTEGTPVFFQILVYCFHMNFKGIVTSEGFLALITFKVPELSVDSSNVVSQCNLVFVDLSALLTYGSPGLISVDSVSMTFQTVLITGHKITLLALEVKYLSVNSFYMTIHSGLGHVSFATNVAFKLGTIAQLL